MNPLDLSGPDFLKFFGVTFVAAIILLILMRTLFLRGGASLASRAGELDTYELAYLSDGPARVAQVAVAALANRGIVKVSADKKLSAAAERHRGFSPEGVVYQAVRELGPATFRQVVARSRRDLTPLNDRLVGAGLLVPPATRTMTVLITLGLMLAVLGLGIAKISVGLQRHKPVGLLIFFCIVAAIVLLCLVIRPMWRTTAGEAMLNQWRRRNEPLRAAAGTAAGNDLLLGVALFGPVLLAGTALADFQHPLQDPGSTSSGSGDGGSGSSCGGSSCGGGGGCGGCGGGGD
jgi:uncharacterized protein (TIGR04222 family)